jgi:hypothetical protein
MAVVEQLFDRNVFQAGAICFREGEHFAHGLTRIHSRSIYLRLIFWNSSFGHGRSGATGFGCRDASFTRMNSAEFAGIMGLGEMELGTLAY